MRFFRPAVLLVVMTASVLTGCSPRPIIIGFQGPLTGTAADLGVQGRNGALLAVEAINAGGGVRGRALQLVPRDDRNERAVALELVQEFRDEKIEVVVGPMTSVAGVAVAERVSTAGPLFISPTVSTAEVSDKNDFFFRIQGASDRPAWVFGRFAAVELGAERVAVLADRDNAEYSATYLEAFSRGVISAGSEVVYTEMMSFAEMHRWTRIVRTISEVDPDTVLVVASASGTARFAQAVLSEGKTWQLLGSGWAATEILPKLGGIAVEDMLLARMSYRPLTATESGAEFRERFMRRFGREPSFAASQAYDAVLLVANALQSVPPAADALRQELSGLEAVDTLLGPVTFNAFGDIEPSATIVRVHQGAYVPVTDYGEGVQR